MGERHQIFVVARVGKRYRTLAVIHHQYLYDCLALSACLLLISIFSDKANRRPLEMELGLAEEFYSDPNNTESDSTTSYASFRAKPVRFPFIGTCLVVGASTAGLDPDFPRASTVHFEPEDTGFAEGDNNTGITVLDITDLDNVRYCFVAWRRIGWRWDLDSDLAQLGPPPPLNTPWSGAEYGRHWQGFRDPGVSIDGKRDRLATKLAEFPLVNVTALADLWPWGMWVVDPSAPTDKTQDDTLKHTGGASLRDQALAKLVQSMLSTPQENMGLLDEPMRFPGFQGALRNQLFTVKDELFQSAAAPGLLRAAWAGETLLDWSRFDGLSPETMMAALQGPELNDARELILCPNWSNTTPLALAQAICSFPSPSRPLHLGGSRQS
ncbi:hypothetical protein NEMBOFW57_003732 [Staphylotrichum longicolle]|uniref:Uncharacterized protein n=1 Tax=Staphylotrichum longicolle TaxID=669026 RepID=A0AAD4F8E8_9PEZI|nr:hypothetical protein NEMBOFW57_003732 [Staphylotrichum longicolle]